MFNAPGFRGRGANSTGHIPETGTGIEINKKLDEFVREKSAEDGDNSFRESRFGFSRDGNYVNPWQMNYERIGYYANTYMIRDVAGDSCVQITVPPTQTGVMPSTQEPQPFGWTGKINEDLAERAVWWAFELLDDGEAGAFLKEHHPIVIFTFYENGRFYELVTRFNGDIWIAESIS